MTINIPDDVAEALQKIAVAQGQPVEQVAVERLQLVLKSPRTPALLLKKLQSFPHPSAKAMDELDAAIASLRSNHFAEAPKR